MTEPSETQEQPEPQTPAEAPASPPEPQQPPEEGADQGEPGEPTEAPEGEPVQQTGPPSEKEIEKAWKRLEGEATRHANRVSEIMEEGAQLLAVCPLCEPHIPGFVMPSPALAERTSAVLAFLGVEEQPELQPDPDSEQCPTCKGWGKVATGSKTETHGAMVCRTCNGAGAVGARFAQASPPPPPLVPAGETNGPTTPTLTPEEQAEIARLRAKGLMVIEPTRMS